MTKRKPLSSAQLEDAARLKKLFKERAKLSQEKFAETFEIGTQGALWQYLAGRIPLNLLVLLKFSKGLEVEPVEISPALAGSLAIIRPGARPAPEAFTLYPIEGDVQSRILRAFSVLNPDQRDEFLAELEAKAATNVDVLSKYVKNLRGVTKERAAERLPAAPSLEKAK
jgi:transcriptional regulator with XRE-family HTH domain